MKTIFCFILATIWGATVAFGGPGTSGGTPGSAAFLMAHLSSSADQSKLLLGDVLYDVNTEEAIGHPMPYIGLGGSALSPDGKLAVSFRNLQGAENFASVWSVESGEKHFDLQQGDALRLVRFTPDGTKIIAVSDHFIKVWDTARGTLLGQTSVDGVDTITISRDSTLLIWQHSGEIDSHYNFGFFDLRIFQPIPNKNLLPGAILAGVTKNSAFDGGTKFAVLNGSDLHLTVVQIFDLQTHLLLHTFGQHVWAFSISANGHRLVTLEMNTLSVWDVSSGALVHQQDVSRFGTDLSLLLSDDGTKLLLRTDDKNHSGREWDSFLMDTATGELNDVTSLVNDNPVESFTLYGNFISLDSSWSGLAIQLHSFVDGKVTHEFYPSIEDFPLISKDGRVLVAMDSGENYFPTPHHPVHVFDGEGAFKKSLFGEGRSSLAAMDMSASGRYALFSSAPTLATYHAYISDEPLPLLSLWDLESGKELAQLPNQAVSREIGGIYFSPDESLLLTLSDKSTKLNLWTLPGHQLYRSITVDGTILKARIRPGHKEIIVEVQNSKDYQYYLQKYDLNTGTQLFQILLQYGEEWPQLLDNGAEAVTIGGTSNCRVWNMDSGAMLLQVERSYQSCVVSPDGQRLYSGAMDGMDVWDIPSKKKIASTNTGARLDSEPYLTVSPDGVYLSTTYLDDQGKQAGSLILRTDTMQVACRSSGVQLPHFFDGGIFAELTSVRDLNFRRCDTNELIRSLRLY